MKNILLIRAIRWDFITNYILCQVFSKKCSIADPSINNAFIRRFLSFPKSVFLFPFFFPAFILLHFTSFISTLHTTSTIQFHNLNIGNKQIKHKLTKGNLINISIENIDYWSVIKAVSATAELTNEVLTVSGFDLKEILDTRLTTPPNFATYVGTADFDAITSSTEDCIKHFWDRNISNPVQAWRRLPAFYIKANLDRGNPEDKYKSRYERLSEVTTKLCETEKLGYEITVSLTDNEILTEVTAIFKAVTL